MTLEEQNHILGLEDHHANPNKKRDLTLSQKQLSLLKFKVIHFIKIPFI